MKSVCELSISLFHTLDIVSLVDLSFVHEVAVFHILSVLNDAYKDTFNMSDLIINSNLFGRFANCLKMLVKSYLLSLVLLWVSFSKIEFLLVPVINSKFAVHKL